MSTVDLVVGMGDEFMLVRDDYDDLSLLNSSYDEQHVEASNMDACNVDGSFVRSSYVVAPTVDLPNVNVPPSSRPRSIRVKVPSANMQTPFTRYSRRKSKRNE